LPIALIPTFANLIVQSRIDRVALGIDVRERTFFAGIVEVLEKLQSQGHELEVLFLEAQDDVLTRRYSETRRRHPLAEDGSVIQGIAMERQLLRDVRQRATRVIDTSYINVHELRAMIQDAYRSEAQATRMHVSVVSFGFKYGVPTNTDLVFDVRFLPNPHFEPTLRAATGQAPEVAAYVLAHAMGQTFMRHLEDFLALLMPLYEQEGKAYLTISLGCTGGRHRSVAISEAVTGYLRRLGYDVACYHRDISKSS
jgi:UPF0042 nucleotide-binding protein